MKIEEFGLWQAFVSVAKFGSFSKASQELSISPPQLSKRIGKLEEQLGVRFFQRSTRTVSLTSEGHAILPIVRTLLQDFENLETQFAEIGDISGTVKVTCVLAIAERFILPGLDRFLRENPHIQVELDMSERFVNLIETGTDIALRIQSPGDTNLVYRKLVPKSREPSPWR